MQNKICMRYIISGRVQGVFYRASAQAEANRLGLNGWARNLATGQVEVLACGEQEKVALLYDWLQKGPELAQVEKVEGEEMPWQEHARFAVK